MAALVLDVGDSLRRMLSSENPVLCHYVRRYAGEKMLPDFAQRLAGLLN